MQLGGARSDLCLQAGSDGSLENLFCSTDASTGLVGLEQRRLLASVLHR